jgi:hypothetical protein
MMRLTKMKVRTNSNPPSIKVSLNRKVLKYYYFGPIRLVIIVITLIRNVPHISKSNK